MKTETLLATDLIDGRLEAGHGERMPVTSPETGATIAEVALADAARVDEAVAAAARAFDNWAATPATARGRLLYRLSVLLDRDRDEIAQVISRDNGKSLADADAEISRAREHIEAAAAAPGHLVGEAVIDILPSLDSQLVREPIGPCAIISPFNFPIMTGSIYWSWAVACGNTVVIKPSEQAPLAATRLGELIIEAGFPPGVINIVHGGREAVEALCDSPSIAALSLVGSSATAQAVYERASRTGKRVQVAGGARNPVVVMDDAPLEQTVDALVNAAFVMAGQRCLSASIVIAVKGVRENLVPLLAERAKGLVVGGGTMPGVQVTPLISRAAVEAMTSAVERAETDGNDVLVDGRTEIQPDGAFTFGPTIIDRVDPGSGLLSNESFGPMISIVEADDLDSAIEIVNSSPFGNAACIFTSSGAAAREFSKRADVGNIGVNVGVAAPTAHVGFGGRRKSFSGTIHSQGRHAIEFFTDIKSVSTKWF
ncbi:CoA-acylating methylmalonate-semialdehyde dehydrogenase [Ruicaihuangia caeni]|uniref:CoA-acylating methylmalonate-semialdehyde dehydrogenase n=1 Tax=Ruicaihuangia caeni TaxID=3042517 RepID=A0AAW6TAZ2_9MICO|nr:CoA-acylating methylmalonate-semialdehyde dehydrogenase [Klugiella sp. YN-L-19]MDI2099143.1 CoA-acylating methylmalonate-semialdehyde dehydrogenase [Klugiella sp. YN-L-19]